MPIYEFKCVKCNEFLEFLFMNQNDKVEVKCPKCNSHDLERILSSTRFGTDSHSRGSDPLRTQTRTCGGGSCTTYDIPGPTR